MQLNTIVDQMEAVLPPESRELDHDLIMLACHRAGGDFPLLRPTGTQTRNNLGCSGVGLCDRDLPLLIRIIREPQSKLPAAAPAVLVGADRASNERARRQFRALFD